MKLRNAIATLALIISGMPLVSHAETVNLTGYDKLHRLQRKHSAMTEEIEMVIERLERGDKIPEALVYDTFEEQAANGLYALPEIDDEVLVIFAHAGATRSQLQTLEENYNGIIAILIGLLKENGTSTASRDGVVNQADYLIWQTSLDKAAKVERMLDEILNVYENVF